ncbi:MAG: condensation domain-containing protein, partial [Actinomycetota bacterium]
MGSASPHTQPLRRNQGLIWASQSLFPEAPVANTTLTFEIDGAIDTERFVAAFDRVVRSSTALRSVIVETENGPAVAVRSEPPAPTEVVDLPLDRLDDWAADRMSIPLAMDRCGYDSVLVRHGPERSTWYLCVHHVITDAWSSALIFAATAA